MYKDYECINGWSNYGDVTIEEGAIFVKKNDYKTFSDYDLIGINYDYDNEMFLLDELSIDPDDNWINKKDIESYSDIKKDDDIIGYILGTYSYYGSWHCGGSTTKIDTIKGLYKTLREMEVIK